MAVRAVLFDMDGVLVDSYEAWFHLLVAAARDLGGPGVTRAAFAAAWGQGVDADVERFFAHRTVDEVEVYYRDHFAEHAHHGVANPDAPGVLAALRERGVGTAIITNTPAPIADATLAPAGLVADVRVAPGAGLAPKPAPDMLRHACERLAVTPAEAMMVGDSRFDAGAARAAAVRFVGFGGIEGDETVARLTELLALIEPG